jgi:Tol biopolymer transport system component
MPISRFWACRAIFIMVCLALAVSACVTSVATPTNTVTPPSQPSPSLTLTSTVTPSPTPLPPPIANGTLAYLMWPSDRRIRLINVVNRETQDIKFDCYFCYAFSFSPDGTQVAFTGWKEFSSHMVDEILLLNVESSEIRRVTKNPLNCKEDASWSPDGKYLLYINTYDCKKLKSNIEIMDLETKATRKLTNTKGWEYGPAWSPNGKYIAYGYRKEGRDSQQPGYLWLMDSDGKNPRQISDMPTGFQFQISWSPDSEKIVFSSPMSCGDIYIADIRTNKTSKFFDTDGCATNPVWSPDGKAIAVLVTTYVPVTNQTKDWKIYLVSVDGKESILIVQGGMSEERPLYLGWVPLVSNVSAP